MSGVRCSSWRALGVLALGVVSCGRAEPNPEPSGARAVSKEQKRELSLPMDVLKSGRVALSRAELKALGEQLVLTGRVVALPGGVAEIGSPIASRIKSVEVSEGSRVRKGELLATLEAPEAARAFGQAQQARARREHAELILAQEQQLASQRATSERALADARSELATATAEQNSAEMLLKSYKAHGQRVELRAPISGVVVQANAVLGAQVSSELTLFRVVAPELFVVRAELPESNAGALHEGDAAEVLPLGTETRCAGKIASVPPSVDPVRRVVACRVVFDVPCAELREGAFAEVVVHDPRGRDAGKDAEPSVVIPRSALVELDGKPAVFVNQGGANRFVVRPVSVRRVSVSGVAIERGLSAGESVVSKGASLLKGEWMRSDLE